MKRFSVCSYSLLLLMVLSEPVVAQNAPTDYRDDFMRHFESSSRKMTMLSEAVPPEKYAWSPMEDVFSIGRVYAHIARYNFYYLESSLGIPAPDDVDLEGLEELTDKAAIRDALTRSIDHVRTHVRAMSNSDLTREVELYGRTVPAWAVLSQLINHMNEHVGQAVSYARMNDIVPPWSM